MARACRRRRGSGVEWGERAITLHVQIALVLDCARSWSQDDRASARSPRSRGVSLARASTYTAVPRRLAFRHVRDSHTTLNDPKRTLIALNEPRNAHGAPQRELVQSGFGIASVAIPRFRSPLQRLLLIVSGALVAAACDRPNASSRKSDRRSATPTEALAATPGFAQQAAPYTARALDSFGRASGLVEIDGPPPADSLVQPSSDQSVCGAGFTRRGIEYRGNRAVGVVVWIDGIRSGKPLPIDRRFEIANDRCLLFPEVQTAIAGGTLNVQNLDALEHRTRITRRDNGELLATIRETDEGQIVPNERVLAKPGVLELTCAAHAWTHAWITVFDHPYFAVTGTDGSFVIDSVPPGRYQVHVWHPRLGRLTDSVTIEANKTTAMTLRARAGS